MSTIYDAIKVKQEICATRPDLQSELCGLIDLANDEIAEGGSAEHEWEMCISAMQDLIT